jgi:peptide/nickel transport system ATP-binding protein
MSSQRESPAAPTSGDSDPVLAVENLRTAFAQERETVYAVDDVSFTVGEGETVGIVGESGSGKSVTARSIMGLIDEPGRILDGSSIRFHGEELVDKTERQYRQYRGSGIGMIFQDPLTSLNPVYTVGNQIREALRLHRGLRGKRATEEAINLLEAVSIPDASRRVSEFPHEFSGGMRQRAVIAMTLACQPDLLICDEPTTALDVTIQAQILELLSDLQDERGLSIIFITHDMGVIAEIADRVNVMYAGEFVESAPVEDLFADPKHPYTRGLLASIPGRNAGADRLETIEGDVPTPNEPATHCRFAPRCPEAFEDCEAVHPQRVDVSEREGDSRGDGASGGLDHEAACLLYPEDLPREEAVAHHRELDSEREPPATLDADGDANPREGTGDE